MREGVAGFLRDKTRKPGLAPLPAAVVDRVVELTLAEPPGETTHWTGPGPAPLAPSPPRWRRRPGSPCVRCSGSGRPTASSRIGCGVSSSPRTRPSLPSCGDVVGLYLDPPAHAVALSVDEKSQIQALDRTHHPQTDSASRRGRACR